MSPVCVNRDSDSVTKSIACSPATPVDDAKKAAVEAVGRPSPAYAAVTRGVTATSATRTRTCSE